jgi:hypothetical protein
MKYLILSLISFISFAQIKTVYSSEFGNFSSASSFYISSNGLVYVTDLGKNELVCYDTIGNKLKDVGGFGWQSGLFDHPVDVFANPLSVYVADKNNHRIQQFDRFLNYVGSFSNRQEEDVEYSFGFPLSLAISNQGDMFILDGENSRVIKFDMFGNFLASFAGIDAGKFRLKKPSSLAIDSKGLVFVADEKSLNIYDNFGNGLDKISFEHPIKSIRIVFDNIVITTNHSVHQLLFENNSFVKKTMELSDVNYSNIRSALIYNNKLYLLLTDKIRVYKIEQTP